MPPELEPTPLPTTDIDRTGFGDRLGWRIVVHISLVERDTRQFGEGHQIKLVAIAVSQGRDRGATPDLRGEVEPDPFGKSIDGCTRLNSDSAALD